MSGLLAAYRRTEYEAGGGAVARIGRRSPAVDALLRRLGAREGAFVTAWNPWSKPMPAGWNARMMARLREAARRLPFAKGRGAGGAGRSGTCWSPRTRAARRCSAGASGRTRSWWRGSGAPARLVLLRRPPGATSARR